jgi:hypothetical protein
VSEAVSSELRTLHTLLLQPFTFEGATFDIDHEFSFEVMQPEGLRIFFHWPPAIEQQVATSAEGAVLTVVASAARSGEIRPSVSRAGLLYPDAAAATSAASVLKDWVPEALLAAPGVPDVERAPAPDIGDEVLWSLTGALMRSNDRLLPRADLGWRRGRVVMCVIAFGGDAVLETSRACAQELDGQLATREGD